MDPRRMAELFDAGSPLSKITTLRPKDYSEARTIGERFRDGTPVIMDLVSMDNADAKRLVDFAAGLAFALRGSFDKVATKVFLLSPADIDVSAEERRRIAEAGFYAYQKRRPAVTPPVRPAGRLATSRWHCGFERHLALRLYRMSHICPQ
jgi:cell division inhibitor SepF